VSVVFNIAAADLALPRINKAEQRIENGGDLSKVNGRVT